MFSFGEVLNNKQPFLFLLELEIKKARKHRNYLSLLSVTLGHLDPLAGENPSIFLKILAHIAKDELRATDIVGQDGSRNRLLVMLPYADMAGAHKMRERLEKIPHCYGFGRKGFAIQIDEACFPTHTPKVDELLPMA